MAKATGFGVAVPCLTLGKEVRSALVCHTPTFLHQAMAVGDGGVRSESPDACVAPLGAGRMRALKQERQSGCLAHELYLVMHETIGWERNGYGPLIANVTTI